MASANLPPCSRLAREKVLPTESQVPSFQPLFSAASNWVRASFQLASASFETAAPDEDFTTLPFSSLAALAGVVVPPAAGEPPQPTTDTSRAPAARPRREVERGQVREKKEED